MALFKSLKKARVVTDTKGQLARTSASMMMFGFIDVVCVNRPSLLKTAV
jgi:hypothetical protein